MKSHPRQSRVLAIDIGGTNVKAGLVDRNGVITGMTHRPSHAAEGRNALLDVLRGLVKEMCAGSKVAAIGVGSPGTIDHHDGSVVYMPAHIPDWSGTPLGKLLRTWSGVPATVDNDVNVIALGENWKGAGKGCLNQVSLAMGTGLGGGIIINGRLYRGARGYAPELGHIVVCPGGEPCTCGNFGCVEVYTAPGAIARRAEHYLRLGVPSALRDCPQITAREIVKFGNAGDHLCRKLLDEAAHYLALLIWNLMQTLEPHVFVLGGGLMKAGKAFLDPLHRELDAFHQQQELRPMYKLRVSQLGDNAGILGAAQLAWSWLDGTDRA